MPAAPELRSRIVQLGEALFQSIHMQLAVERYAAEAVGRAANLDTLDTPVGDTMWMRRQILTIRALPGPNAQVAAIRALLSRTDPGPAASTTSSATLPIARICSPGPVLPKTPAVAPRFAWTSVLRTRCGTPRPSPGRHGLRRSTTSR